MTTQIRRLTAMFAAAFGLVILAAGYWGFVRSEALLARGDNPRRVLDERRSVRGRIEDRNEVILAEAVGTPGALVRSYPYPALAPVLGYVSPLYGLAGVEAALDEHCTVGRVSTRLTCSGRARCWGSRQPAVTCA
jgi:hypothetical protein